MKRLLFLISMVCLILSTSAGVTLAANSGPHGNFAYSLDGCAACHSSHNSTYDKLMKFGYSPTEVCYQCHNGTGSTSNVELGTINSAPSLGGAFELNVPLGSKTVTSAHMVGKTYTKVYGGFYNNGTENVDLVNFNFQCASCHNPHGSPNYRLIKTKINGFTVTFSEGTADNYNNTGQTAVIYYSGTTSLCSACHGKYKNIGTTTQVTDPVTGMISYLHRIDFDPATGNPSVPYDPSGTTTGYYLPGVTTQVPLQTNAPAGPPTMTCITCHYAHGSKVAAPDVAVFASDPDETGTPHATSSLLRDPGRQVCAKCHPLNSYY